MNHRLFICFFLFVFSALLCAENPDSFAKVNPFFMGEFPYSGIDIDLLKNKVFHETHESYDFDKNGRRTYGDTYARTVTHYYYYFDTSGRIARWLSMTVQNEADITDTLEITWRYEDNAIFADCFHRGNTYIPGSSVYRIARIDETDIKRFNVEHISGSRIRSQVLGYSTKEVRQWKVDAKKQKNGWMERDEHTWSVPDNSWITRSYKDDELAAITIRTYSGVVIERSTMGHVVQTTRNSTANGTGVRQYFRDGVLQGESTLERRMNPAGFLEFEKITTKAGGVTTYCAEIVRTEDCP